MRQAWRVALVVALATAACGKDSPTTPSAASTISPAPTSTKVMSLTGNLSFGSVAVGSTAVATLTIGNSGTATLTVSSIACPTGYTANWSGGMISAGGSQVVTIRFSPMAPQTYAGTLTVYADHTSGTNTIATSGTGTGTPAAGSAIAGRALDVFTSAGLASITVRLPDGTASTTAADGTFSLAAPAGLYTTTLSGSGVVERQTALRFPAPDTQLGLIPSSFDLMTFDQMCRGGGVALRRWSTAPKLIVIDAVLQFTSITDSTFVATGERLTTEEVQGLAADLAWGLPQVTGQAFTGFSSVTTESPAAGAQVPFFTREGAVVAARFKGLTTGTTYWGYGRWASRSSVVVAGAVMLDRDFELSGSMYRRSLRVHEMGHALGWDHVTLRISFMNSNAQVEPNAFDKDATRLAFLRTPGNQTPDRDPWPISANLRAFPLVWGPITP
jgi:hypothetical protein